MKAEALRESLSTKARLAAQDKVISALKAKMEQSDSNIRLTQHKQSENIVKLFELCMGMSNKVFGHGGSASFTSNQSQGGGMDVTANSAKPMLPYHLDND